MAASAVLELEKQEKRGLDWKLQTDGSEMAYFGGSFNVRVYDAAYGQQGVVINIWGDKTWLGSMPNETRAQAKKRAAQELGKIAKAFATAAGGDEP